LFGEADQGSEKVAKAVDAVTDRFGRNALQRARLVRGQSEPPNDGDDEREY
jgi:hypothetical protein